jgi:hypothetical protein
MEPMEAHESLAMIKEARQATRIALARGGTGYLFVIWGIVWLFGFLGSQLLDEGAGYLWLALDTFGVLGSTFAILRYARHVRSPYGWRMGVFWVLLIGYGALLAWVVWPLDGTQYLLFVTLVISMGYSMLGLWTSTPLAIMGVAISVLAVLGWQILPEYLGYWLAFTGGGGLIAAGLYVLRAWK